MSPSVFVQNIKARTKTAGAYRSAGLDEELADWRPVVHGVEGGDLVDPHGGHLKDAGDLVHDADAGEAVLALSEVQQRHDGRLLVLWWVPLEDLGDDGFIFGGKFEGDAGVVVGCVSMLLRVEYLCQLLSSSSVFLVVIN
jgi:hypothetical protein